MSHDEYDLKFEELLNRYTNVCARLGVSNSGLVISFGGTHLYDEMLYLRGVLIAKYNGLTPPFKRGDEIRPKSGKRSISTITEP